MSILIVLVIVAVFAVQMRGLVAGQHLIAVVPTRAIEYVLSAIHELAAFLLQAYSSSG